MTSQEKAAVKAADFIKNCEYKGTAIKVELEAQLSRGGDCYDCDGRGENECYDCDGYGCDDCDNGRVECSSCYGTDYSLSWCKEYLHSAISQEAKEALIFDKVYDDGSVDTEWTLTIPIDKVLLLPQYLRAFREMAEEIGHGIDVDGAGMHIAILNSANGTYPRGNGLSSTRFRNFKKSMDTLLPALVFLGTSNATTRGFNYRNIRVSSSDKYSAINASSDVFEYRVFDTCYDKPEAIFDYLCVIANTLRFYTMKYVDPEINFKGEISITDERVLSKIFKQENHIRYLNKALRVLKPHYKPLSVVKKERGYDIKIKDISKVKRKIRNEAIIEWAEYSQRAKAEEGRYAQRAREEWRRAVEISREAENSANPYYISPWILESYGSEEEYVKAVIRDRGIVTSLKDYVKMKTDSHFNGGYCVATFNY